MTRLWAGRSGVKIPSGLEIFFCATTPIPTLGFTLAPGTAGCRPRFMQQWRDQDFFFGGVQQIQLRTEDRENGDLGAVAP